MKTYWIVPTWSLALTVNAVIKTHHMVYDCEEYWSKNTTIITCIQSIVYLVSHEHEELKGQGSLRLVHTSV